MTPPTVKCLVWDLDDTLWDGVVLEGDRPRPFPAAVEALRELDRRGILHAAASRGDHETALRHLAEHGLDELFCAVEINWGAKSDSVRRIAETLNIGLDTLAFLDNDQLERAEVGQALPQVRCYPAEQAGTLAERPEFQPAFVTAEASQRRQLYRAEAGRKAAEAGFGGPNAEFLSTLDLELTVRPAAETDLERAHELTVRTHQLNTTGRTFDLDQLRALCADPEYQVLVASLRDRFGDYGTIGLAVSRTEGDDSVLQLLLMSCRVMSRGVGTVLLDHLVRSAVAAGRRPVAHFVANDVNRVMLVTLRFAGFELVERRDALMVLAIDPARLPAPRASHVKVLLADQEARS